MNCRRLLVLFLKLFTFHEKSRGYSVCSSSGIRLNERDLRWCCLFCCTRLSLRKPSFKFDHSNENYRPSTFLFFFFFSAKLKMFDRFVVRSFSVCLGETDLAFLMHSSMTRGEDFQEAKNFVWSVIQNFDISNNDTQVGLIRFSTQASVIFNFQFSTDSDVLLLKEMVDNIAFAEGSDSQTERALQLARTDLFSAKGGSRPDVPKILVVIIYGKSENLLAVARASMALKRNHVTIIVVGIGDNVNIEELLTMSSGFDNSISVRTFKELKKRVGRIKDKICDGKLRTH